MKSQLDELTALERYSAAAELSSRQIITVYSTSFGTATRLLGHRHRSHIRNIYALVRVADELVDGATAEARLTSDQQHQALDQLESETASALALGYSSNPIVHAFARTARATGIDATLTGPFFRSMRADLAPRSEQDAPQRADAFRRFGDDAHSAYVYGSAEVVGLMCLRVFVRDEILTAREREALEHGARRLGAAFQNVNFLRDLADDTSRLGRSYLSEVGHLDQSQHARWIARIRAELADAEAALQLLPRDTRVAVGTALGLFSRLTDLLAATPTEQLYGRRVRVSGPEKALVVVQSVLQSRRRRVA